MINRPLLKKYLIESAILFVACAVAVFAFGWFRTWIVGELDTAQFRQIVDLLPQDWRKFSSVDFDWLVSYLGRTALTLDEPMLILFVSLWCIIRGTDVVSGEIGRGTMEMVLGQPISRRRLYFQHMFLTLVGVLLLCCLVWMGMCIGIYTTSVEETTYPEIQIPLTDYKFPLTFLGPKKETIAMSSQVNPVQFVPGVINLFCLMVFLSCFSAFCSAWDRYRWRSLGIVIGFYFVNALMKFASMSSESFSWLRHLNCFGYYEPAPTIQMEQANPGSMWQFMVLDSNGRFETLGPMAHNSVLVGLGVFFLLWGWWIFRSRDLPAPI